MISFVAYACSLLSQSNHFLIFMKQADSTGVRQAKDTVGWIKKAMIGLYDATFSAHFSLDGPKIDSDNGFEESEGHYDSVSWLS